mgnify:FL=1
MNLRKAMCQALVDGWHGDWKMGRVVQHAWILTDTEPANEVEKYSRAAEAVRVKYLHAADGAQPWIARNMRSLNEALWAGRPRDTCVACAERTLGLHTKVAMAVSVRARDKRSDWKTVK